MAKEIKYYSYTDRVTGTFSKSVGYEEQKETKRIRIREVNSKLQVTINESKIRTIVSKPKGDNVKELSKDDYDKLDVSGEHPFLTQLRKQAELRLLGEKSAAQDYKELSIKSVPVDAQAILASLQTAQDKLKAA